MRRREFIGFLGGAAVAWPLAARAQQPERMRRVGALAAGPADAPDVQVRLAAFKQGLQQLGWIEGRNLRIEYRLGALGDAERTRKYASDLVALAPDVIFANGTSQVGPLLEATRTVPIIFTAVADPVGAGFVDSLARPGGNATGFVQYEYGLGGKWLELLKEIAPRVTRAAVLRDAAITAGVGLWGAIQTAAPSFGGKPSQRARRERDRAHPHSLRARTEWRLDLNWKRVVGGSWRSDRRDRHEAQTARCLLLTPIRRRRRPDLLWSRYRRPVPACGQLRGSHPHG
jgi:hypothetical protein